ncbi:ABL200Wp [Eremothecium gossypii ATCC 10895]|uniref:ABL200Wp n=1 Tax=Eremothecium gossypii (strain ATCC 10895 / CBS 109.51 / FGSC 9923 / NRRL Y-1056) TaxID=284811 RepID=Q75E70_EREGS|nr:ABL200Wp [Eremothecium gossypii ATCC 10895]AAS50571.1 ABL200Wp [Eremothecium gossypii ATCC 10895]AEY94859.1 FABL200Wp [Eremothecium gossypii FDAG1]
MGDFYSSESNDNVRHARSLRNSVLLEGDVGERGAGSHGTGTETFYESTWESSLHDVGFSDDECEDGEETATQAFMTASPSLSALAGILSEKSKQAEEKMRSRSSTLLGTTIEEDGEDDGLPGAPRVERSSVESALRSRQPLGGHALHSQTHLRHNSVLEADDNGSIASSFQAGSMLSRTINRVRSRSVTSTITDQANSSGSGAVSMLKKRFPSMSQPKGDATPEKTQRKRRSVFSFLRRKSSAASLAESNASGEPPGIPTSSTFSVTKSASKESLTSATKLTKKSYSSSSLFSTFKRNKDNNRSTENISRELRESLNTKKRTVTRPILEDNDDVAVRIDISDPNALFQQTPSKYNKESRTSISYSTAQTTPKQELPMTPKPALGFPRAESPSSTLLENMHKVDSGEAVFPKSLNPLEVESIVSMERSRSHKSNRNSMASYRRSLTDNISIKAQNEGMFVTEASEVILSTPDLTKSPTNSILRNGTFESLDGIPKSSDISLDDYTYSLTIPHKDGEEGMNFSFSSIQEKLNELTMDTDEEEEEIKEVKVTPVQTPILPPNTDPDFMSDIAEFANIIDFGDEVDFDLELGTGDLKYKTLNPKDILQSDTLRADIRITSSSEYLREAHEPLGDEPRRVTIGCDLTHDLSLKTMDYYDEDIDNEHFALDGEEMHPETVDPYLPAQSLAVNRPLSMSFRGLTGPQFNRTHDLPRLNSEIGLNSYTMGDNDRSVHFSTRILLHDTYTEDEYDRRPDIATCNQLTPQLAQLIKEELNQVKSEMEIHEDSRCYTHFY